MYQTSFMKICNINFTTYVLQSLTTTKNMQPITLTKENKRS